MKVRKRFSGLVSGLQRTRETLSNFTPFLAPRWRGLLLALAVLLVETVTSLAQPWPLALTIDYVLSDNKSLPEWVPGLLKDEALFLAGIAFLIVLIFTITRLSRGQLRLPAVDLAERLEYSAQAEILSAVRAGKLTTTHAMGST